MIDFYSDKSIFIRKKGKICVCLFTESIPIYRSASWLSAESFPLICQSYSKEGTVKLQIVDTAVLGAVLPLISTYTASKSHN